MTAVKKTGQAAADSARPGEDGRVDAAELELARQLAGRAQAEGLSLTGPGGLLGRLTKVVLEGALSHAGPQVSIGRVGSSRVSHVLVRAYRAGSWLMSASKMSVPEL
jgi:hypothetical protein